MIRLKLLRYLFRLRDRWILPQAIASDIESRPELVHRAVEALLEEGYPIEHHPTYGYRFLPGDDLIDPARLEASLETSRIGLEIHSLRETDSTMDTAWELFGGGAPSGTVVIADTQRRGRGRFQRAWESPRGGGLWMSVILHRADIPRPYSLLTVSSAIAVAEAVEEESGRPTRIRWPNDILMGDRKLGGILIEMRQEGDAPLAVVLGIGINVHVQPSDLPETVRNLATSLAREGSKRSDRRSLARGVISSLDTWWRRVIDGGAGTLREPWRSRSSTLGRPVALLQGDRRYDGVVVDLDPVDGLTLDLGGGDIRAFPAEQVTLIPSGEASR